MKNQLFPTLIFFLLSSTVLAQNTPAIIAAPLQGAPPTPTAATPGESTVQPPTVPVIANPLHINDIRSMLFSPGDVQALRNARRYYEQTIKGVDKGTFSEDDFLKKLEKVTTDKLDAMPQSFTYPQFFLSSIAYRSPNDWVVWVNSEKITQDSGATPSGLIISHIEPERVTFEWVPQRMDKIVDINEYSDENPVKVDLTRKKVHFTLKTNQTFTSYAMRVVEGKVPPVIIDNTKAGITTK